MGKAVADPGEGPGETSPPPPLCLGQNEAQRAEETAPPKLKVWMTGPPLIWWSGSAIARVQVSHLLPKSLAKGAFQKSELPGLDILAMK